LTAERAALVGDDEGEVASALSGTDPRSRRRPFQSVQAQRFAARPFYLEGTMSEREVGVDDKALTQDEEPEVVAHSAEDLPECLSFACCALGLD
jgi:hypothetical protein